GDDGEGDAGSDDARRAVDRSGLQPDVAARPDDGEGVVDEVAEDPVEGDSIRDERTASIVRTFGGAGDREIDAGGARPGCEPLDGRLQDRVRVERLEVDGVAAGPQAVDRAELADQPLEALRLFGDRRSRALRVRTRGRPVSERRRVATDHRQRRPEVVPKVGEQLAFASARAGELDAEAVDPSGELADLSGSGLRQRLDGPVRRIDELVRPAGDAGEGPSHGP